MIRSSAVVALCRADLSIVEVHLPGEPPTAAGVILTEPATGDYRMRFRRDWESFAGDEAEVLALIAADFDEQMSTRGADAWLQECEGSLSHVLRVADREQVMVETLDKAIDHLYRAYVQPNVLPFVTHLPRFSARVAAGNFLEDNAVEAEEWLETPQDVRLDTNMFVVQITGRSMEPLIPDASLCIFRTQVTGTRQGKLLLIERSDVSESGGRYTVKRYRSGRTQNGEEWRHSVIHLEPLNAEFEAWELEDDPEKFRVIGEFVRVLNYE